MMLAVQPTDRWPESSSNTIANGSPPSRQRAVSSR